MLPHGRIVAFWTKNSRLGRGVRALTAELRGGFLNVFEKHRRQDFTVVDGENHRV